MITVRIVKNLYYQMLRIRLFEQEIAKEYSKQEIRCPVHLCIGQEAIAVGVCAHLKKADIVMSNHRSHGHYLAKGGDSNAFIAELYGKSTGCSKGRGGSQHLIDLVVNFYGSTPIVAGSIPVATGVAWSCKLKKEARIVTVFFGEAAIEEGVFHESLNFASLYQLPILYICENNFYSILTPIATRQPRRPIYELAKAHGINSCQYDGNNVIDVYTVASQTVDYVRSGKGPAFIEFQTYRMKEHCGPEDDPIGARPEEEIKYWAKKDPIKSIETYLFKKVRSLEKEFAGMRVKIENEIHNSFTFAKTSPYLSEKPSLENIFA